MFEIVISMVYGEDLIQQMTEIAGSFHDGILEPEVYGGRRYLSIPLRKARYHQIA